MRRLPVFLASSTVLGLALAGCFAAKEPSSGDLASEADLLEDPMEELEAIQAQPVGGEDVYDYATRNDGGAKNENTYLDQLSAGREASNVSSRSGALSYEDVDEAGDDDSRSYRASARDQRQELAFDEPDDLDFDDGLFSDLPTSAPEVQIAENRRNGRTANKAKDRTSLDFASGATSSSTAVNAEPPPAVTAPVPTPKPDVARYVESNTESYEHPGINDMTLARRDALSTFSIDVDTASYTIARRKLLDGYLPPTASVRVEEFVNYFPYSYVQPTGDAPFAVNMEAAPNPFEPRHHVLRIGVQGDELSAEERKPVRLTFLVDVSGSMSSQDKLGLAKRSLHLLVDGLDAEDSVALGTYAGATQMVLNPTSARNKDAIHAAIESLSSGGGTAMSSGIDMAYQMAQKAYVPGAENRVVVLSDGDANIGPSSHQQILTQIQGYAKQGISLTTVGFGMGNYQDTMMEQLANDGDGNYFYIDGMDEARKVFVEDLGGTIQTIARDVKIQVEFDPDTVYAYRLIGYENRDIADRDFRNDAVDAGEVGSGHKVTALYDVVLSDDYDGGPLATVRLRNKPPGPDAPAEEWLTSFPEELLHSEFAAASNSFRLAFSAAMFAELLRDSPYAAELSYREVREVASGAADGKEAYELVELIETASKLAGERGSVAWR